MYICICVCCYSSRLVVIVCTEHQQYNTHSKLYVRVYVVPFRVDVFLPCGQGLEFTSAYVRNQSINIRKHKERCHVNREEFRE